MASSPAPASSSKRQREEPTVRENKKRPRVPAPCRRESAPCRRETEKTPHERIEIIDVTNISEEDLDAIHTAEREMWQEERDKRHDAKEKKRKESKDRDASAEESGWNDPREDSGDSGDDDRKDNREDDGDAGDGDREDSGDGDHEDSSGDDEHEDKIQKLYNLDYSSIADMLQLVMKPVHKKIVDNWNPSDRKEENEAFKTHYVSRARREVVNRWAKLEEVAGDQALSPRQIEMIMWTGSSTT